MFEFLKYIQPGNYYRLVHQMPQVILSFPLEVENKLGYASELAEKMDAAYCRLQTGWIPNASDERSSLQNDKITNIGDNYIFINRYFSKTQVLYVLLIRLFTLKNPVFEMVAFIKALKFSRVKIEPKLYPGFEKFESSLVKSQPLVSVIIPTLNRYEYLKDVLKDLENQSYTNFEVIVCDQSEPINESFYERWNLNIQLIKQEEKALWLARNNAIKNAKGEFIALTEDDVALPIDWLTNHLKCLDFFDTDASAGLFYRNDGNTDKLSIPKPTFKYSQQFPTGNTLIKKNVFQKIGLFDCQFEKQRMGDGEFGLRALLAGFRIISNPMAFIIDVKAPTGGLRQMGSWDAIRPKNLLAPRPIPSVLYLIRKYHNAQEAILYLIKNIPQSYVPYKYKGNKIITLLIFTLFPLWLPLAFISVTRSWKLATIKLKQGDLIEYLG
jgi:glycosyltransferase involved in cell wall biosynthesis